MTTNKQLDDLLKFDALDTAEKITGDDYKTSDETTALGAVLMQRNARAKEEALRGRGDTTHNDNLDRYLKVIEVGFVNSWE